jgi:hypothetical protein
MQLKACGARRLEDKFRRSTQLILAKVNISRCMREMSAFQAIFKFKWQFLVPKGALFLQRLYKYEQLPCCKAGIAHSCQFIRIVNIVRADEERIDCELKVHRLPEADTWEENFPKHSGFHCLSYTWGDAIDEIPEPEPLWIQQQTLLDKVIFIVQHFTHFICGILRNLERKSRYNVFCNGQTIPITDNLRDGLITLHKDVSKKDQMQAIWIDQICINQDDRVNAGEKTSQLKVMGQIYEKAMSVIVWLGATKPESNMEYVQQIADKLHRLEEQVPSIKEDRTDVSRWIGFQAQLRSQITQEQWLSVFELLRMNYFRRMWVFQEIVVAAQVSIVCGKDTISWEHLCNVSQIFSQFGIDTVLEGAGLSQSTIHGNVALQNLPHSIDIYRHRFFENPQRGLRPFLGGLVTENNRAAYSCQEGQDKLYAHFGVCRYKDIEIDSSKSARDVYIQFWTHVFQKLSDVNFLTAVDEVDGGETRRWSYPKKTSLWQRIWNGKTEAPLPSWVPDFGKPRLPVSLTQHYTMPNPESGKFNICRFNAAGLSSKPNLGPFSFDITRDNLFTTKGYPIDAIAVASETHTEMDITHVWAIPRLLEILLWIANDRTVYRRPQASHEALMTTLIIWSLGSAEDEDKLLNVLGTPYLSRLLRSWILYILSTPAAHGISHKYPPIYSSLLAKAEASSHTLIPTLSEISQAASVHRDFLIAQTVEPPAHPLLRGQRTPPFLPKRAAQLGEEAFYHTRLIRTARGYIGKAGRAVRAGDEVWVFPGGYVPFVLRRTGNGTYKLVTHGYIHGVMEGELVGELVAKEKVDVVIA